jgi:hypothetical protein
VVFSEKGAKGVQIVNRRALGKGWEQSPDSVYIGRGSEWGNPFVIGRDGDRAAVIAKYRAWFLQRVTEDEGFRRRLRQLEGKTLVCYCAPAACHGDVLKWWLENE